MKIVSKVEAPSRERIEAYLLRKGFKRWSVDPRMFQLVRDTPTIYVVFPRLDVTNIMYDAWAEQTINNLSVAFWTTTGEIYHEIMR